MNRAEKLFVAFFAFGAGIGVSSLFYLITGDFFGASVEGVIALSSLLLALAFWSLVKRQK